MINHITGVYYMIQGQKDKIIEIARNNAMFKDVEITENTRFIEDLGMDDLDIISTVMEIEDEYGVFLECNDNFDDIKTIGDIFSRFEEAE